MNLTDEEPPAKYDREYEVALYRRYGLDLDELERPLESSGVVGNRKHEIYLYVFYVFCVIAGAITGLGLGASDEQLILFRGYFF